MTLAEQRIEGTFRQRYLRELFGSSGHFPISLIVLESLSTAGYWRESGPYLLCLCGLLQTYVLVRREGGASPLRFFGNLVGPLVYSCIELVFEGPGFFLQPHHLAYWCYACVVGGFQSILPRVSVVWESVLLLAIDVTRASILFVLYTIFEFSSERDFTWTLFISDPTHQFMAIAVFLLGMSVGLAHLVGKRYHDLLMSTSRQLHLYSEWLLGRELLGRLISDPSALALQRRERTVLFMDIRGFTRWSDSRSPERVVAMLDAYYRVAERVLNAHGVVKFKFSADEVMAVFGTSLDALAAAHDLCREIEVLLDGEGLGAGIGLNAGPVVEGLLGSSGVRFYDVIGDTVNTAKRIESAAVAGEILVSASVRDDAGAAFILPFARKVEAKGKSEPLELYRLERRT